MHPIVHDFINTSESLTLIIEKKYNKDQYLEKVFLDLAKSQNMMAVEDAIFNSLDQAILIGHPDESLYLLFISFTIPFICNRLGNKVAKLDRARAIHSIGSSIITENIHPVLRSYYAGTSAKLKFTEGNLAECDLLIKESLAIINKKSPRYVTILASISLIISHQGKLSDLSKTDLELMGSDQVAGRAFLYVTIKLVNCIMIGNYKEGLDLIEEYKRKSIGDNSSLIYGMLNIFKILSGDFDTSHFEEDIFKKYASACLFLLEGKLEDAQKTIQNIDADAISIDSLYFSYINYFPLHIELCLKNKGKSRLLLQEIMGKGGYNYMIDFFMARLQLLEMNREGACESFSRLIENVNRYGAIQRLQFEMQFAKEINATDILFLMNGLRDAEGLKIQTVKSSDSTRIIQTEKGVKSLIGESQAIIQLKKLVKKFAGLKEPVLITGETGTGKELVSRAIHEEGPHSKEPFLAINCGSLTESLLESELFGYEAGAFTGAMKERKGIFEAAGKGTVFLDEFGDISPKTQVSLLRILESGEIRLIGGVKTRQVECKIVIATNIDLQKAVEEKRFREDLYFRLNKFDLKLPPLRERVEDIPQLIQYFLNDQNDSKKKPKSISISLQDALISYRWPGNIRELKNEIERLKILYPDKEIINIQDFDFSHLQGYVEPAYAKKINEKAETSPILKSTVQNISARNENILKIFQKGSKVNRRISFIKELFKEYKKLTRLQIIEMAEVSPVTASSDLEFLCKSGFIEKCKPTKSVKSFYFVLLEKNMDIDKE